MTLLDVLAAVLLVTGAVFLLAGALGVLRFPDFYTRLHAAGKGDTLGQTLILLGLMVSAGLTLTTVKLALIVFFVFIFNPTATHALARGAWLCGLRPWRGEARPFRQEEAPMEEAEREAMLEEGARRFATAPRPDGPAPAGGTDGGDAWTT